MAFYTSLKRSLAPFTRSCPSPLKPAVFDRAPNRAPSERRTEAADLAELRAARKELRKGALGRREAGGRWAGGVGLPGALVNALGGVRGAVCLTNLGGVLFGSRKAIQNEKSHPKEVL